MSQEWGAQMTDYVNKSEDMCDKCRRPCKDRNFEYAYAFCGFSCCEDYVIKNNYNRGRVQEAVVLLRVLPSEMLNDYLREERRTPTELKVVILDELQKRNETENSMRL